MSARKRFAWLIEVLMLCLVSVIPQYGAVTDEESESEVSPSKRFDELKKQLHERYDGKSVTAMVSGLYAGEQEQAFIVGPGKNALIWAHFHQSAKMPKRGDLHQLDDQTFAQLLRGAQRATSYRQARDVVTYRSPSPADSLSPFGALSITDFSLTLALGEYEFFR
jgi:hypothetical protein